MTVYIFITMFFTMYMFYPELSNYQIKCPDGSNVIEKGLHICCNDYCVLCRRLVEGFDTSCATNCNGILVDESTLTPKTPLCKDCQCRQPMPREKKEENTGEIRKCPFMKKK